MLQSPPVPLPRSLGIDWHWFYTQGRKLKDPFLPPTKKASLASVGRGRRDKAGSVHCSANENTVEGRGTAGGVVPRALWN